MKLKFYSSLFLFLFVFSSFAFSQESTETETQQPAPSAVEPPYSKFFKTNYLDLAIIYNDLAAAAIENLIPPPVDGTEAAEDDYDLRENVYSEATKKQVHMAKDSEDSVFSYSYTLGDEFCAHHLPKTKALFDKVDDDVRLAIYIAKRFYGRRRPMHSSGYSYPSGHSTRAFLWDVLLAEIFPSDQTELENQAKRKAWNRVILGRHYPADVYAGKAFGTYLAQKLFENVAFQKEWPAVEKEIKDCVGKNAAAVTVSHALGSGAP